MELRVGTAREIAEREAAFFRHRAATAAEWKVFSHDKPAGLESALAGAGWTGEEAETFVVLDIEQTMPPADAAEVEIRHASSRSGFADFLAERRRQQPRA